MTIAKLTERLPRCAHCGKPASCFGTYEGNANYGFACDDCCGHGNEDGNCTTEFETIGEWMNAAVRDCDEESDALAEARAERDLLLSIARTATARRAA